jgi:peroxiredoxin
MRTVSPNQSRGRRLETTLTTVVVAVVLVAILTGCGGEAEPSSGLVEWPNRAGEEVGPAIGMLAPNFVLPTVAGEILTLSEATGSPIVLNFFASWCASCREEMAMFEQANQDGTTVIGVDLREKSEVVQALADETGATFPLALDRTGEVTRAYKVTNLPATYLLDAEGRVVTMVRGPLNEEGLESLLAMTRGAEGEA